MKSEVLQKAQPGWIGKETPSGLTKSARMPLPGLWVALPRQPSHLAAVLYANVVLEKGVLCKISVSFPPLVSAVASPEESALRSYA